jgi:hypothetical protein
MTSVETQTTTDNKKPRYIKALPYSNCGSSSGLIIIDLEFLKNSPLLEDATIFKKLFGLEENDDTFYYDLTINEKFETPILQDFRITKENWKNFIFFLRQGSVPESSLIIDYIINNDKLSSIMRRVLDKLESVMETCITFGGVPKFDEYYTNYFKKLNTKLCEKKYCEYNPGNPREDNLNRYIWASHYSTSIVYIDFIKMHKVSDGWSVASSISSHFVWYRKLKNGDESDIDAVYTASEVGNNDVLIQDQHEGQIQNDIDESDLDQSEEEGGILDEDPADGWETPYHSGW